MSSSGSSSPSPSLRLHHPDPIDLIRESCMLTKFQSDMDFPGHLVSWLSTWLLVWYRSGMVCAYPRRTPITFPVGIGGQGSIGEAWIQQELRTKGEALVDDLLCVGITGGLKLGPRDWRPVTKIEFVSPRQVKLGGKLYAPGRSERLMIGVEVRARLASGKIVEAMHPMSPQMEHVD